MPRPTKYLPLDYALRCFHYPNLATGVMGECRGREEHSFLVEGKKANYIAKIDDNGCSKCEKEAEERATQQVIELEKDSAVKR